VANSFPCTGRFIEILNSVYCRCVTFAMNVATWAVAGAV
jgi:hypothetical protein